jgi:hypothetical protein
MASVYLEITCAAFPNVLAGMTLRKSPKSWSESEEENHQSTKKVFVTKSGTWDFVSDGTITILKHDGVQVGTLNDLDPGSVSVNDSGSGYSTEKDLDFRWTALDPAKEPKHLKAGA